MAQATYVRDPGTQDVKRRLSPAENSVNTHMKEEAVRKHVSSAVVAAAVSALVASGGAFAAQKYLITSKSQIAPKVVKQLKGNRGARGARGPRGLTGATGARGPAGVSAVGSAGAAGARGPAGPAGSTGARGPAGPAGSDGKNGSSVTMQAVGNDVCPGSVNGGVTLSGDGGPQVICSGQNGAQGDPGPQGPSGVSGWNEQSTTVQANLSWTDAYSSDATYPVFEQVTVDCPNGDVALGAGYQLDSGDSPDAQVDGMAALGNSYAFTVRIGGLPADSWEPTFTVTCAAIAS